MLVLDGAGKWTVARARARAREREMRGMRGNTALRLSTDLNLLWLIDDGSVMLIRRHVVNIPLWVRFLVLLQLTLFLLELCLIRLQLGHL